jgi:hypothetical protein
VNRTEAIRELAPEADLGAPTRRDVLIYELNEVPWQIVELYVGRRPQSTFASVVERAQCLTTVNADPASLTPWRTWPTFHTGLYTQDHNSWALGQDPETLRGESIWDVAERAGRGVGMFGVPQSWPPRQFANDGFCVPDTFARDAKTNPESLSRFQEFNLSMTAENAFSSNAPLNGKRMLQVGADIALKGLTPRSGALLMRQLVRERRDARWKAARPMTQALPAFDLFWRLHTRRRPGLSLFFSNHLAGVMHRYWGDAVPGYTDQYDYLADEVFGKFLFEALEIFEGQLRRILRWVARNPSTVLVIASSMGQGPIEYREVNRCYLLRDSRRLTNALGLERNEPSEAMMYPEYVLSFETPEGAEHAVEQLARVELGGKAFFENPSAAGRSVTAKVTTSYRGDSLSVRAADGDGHTAVTFDDLGVTVEERLGGGNTAYHVPEGIWIALGGGGERDASRAEVSVLEAKSRILDLLGIGVQTPPARRR